MIYRSAVASTLRPLNDKSLRRRAAGADKPPQATAATCNRLQHLLGAGALILTSRLEQSEYLSNVEWDTLLFMVGLFIMVGALFKTGVIKILGELAAGATGGNALLTTMLILGVSTLVSGSSTTSPTWPR